MTDTQLDEAYSARQAGDDARAAKLCQDILAGDPGHPGARSLMAVYLAESGQLARALPLAEQALAADPRNWRFLLNLSVVQQLGGDVEAAIENVRLATTVAPERFEVWGRLGDLLGGQGDFIGAVEALGQALDLNPRHAAVALRLAGAAYEIGEYERCSAALDRFEQVVPGHPEALRLRTHLAQKLGDADGMLAAASRWLDAEHGSDAARVALAYAHSLRDEYPSAIETYRPLVESHPGDAVHAATFAQYLLWARDFEGAEEYYSHALALDPVNPDAAAGMARVHVYNGRLEDASELAQRAVEADPKHVEGYAQLALANGSRLSDGQLDRLTTVADDPSVDPSHRVIAWFTIGDVHHRRADRERAFEAWQNANDLKRQTSGARYDAARMEKRIDRLIGLFGAPVATEHHVGSGGPTPIFIVGMPRSGTTLLDSALAAHPQIASGGELPEMPNILDRFLDWAERSGWNGGIIPEQVLRQLRAAYLQQYQTYRIVGAGFVTDKQPINFLSVGLISQLFPAAPIIHTKRNPLETGFSIYRKNFTRAWAFSTSLQDIGHYYGQYARLMRHWTSAFRERVTEVSHAQLVHEFEPSLRRIVARTGLEWDSACLEYHQRKSVVTTLSATQVRKPPSAEHLNSTAPYAAMLQPLREALEAAGVAAD